MHVCWMEGSLWGGGCGAGERIRVGAWVGRAGRWVSVKAWGRWLTDVPEQRVIGLHLPAPDDVPDAGHPVGEECEDGHEQREHHSAALGVALQLLQQPQQPQQPHCLQQVHQ